jgi:hypothetical protein
MSSNGLSEELTLLDLTYMVKIWPRVGKREKSDEQLIQGVNCKLHLALVVALRRPRPRCVLDVESSIRAV